MKILIGYDGSETASAALDSLQYAGLPQSAEALIISVAEVWLPPQTGRRGKDVTGDSPIRIVVGFDGSAGAKAAIEALAARSFSENCEVRLFTATDPMNITEGGSMFAPASDFVWEGEEKHRQFVEQLAEETLENFKKAGFNTTFHLRTGNPRQILIEEAEDWNADAIFVGANAFGSRLERLLLGSVSAAIAARAHCSVEVVRRKKI